eukprot:g6069.t1
MSWPEMMLATNWTNGTEIMAAACEGFKDALGPNGTAVFGYNQGQAAPLFYPEVLALTQDLERYGDFFLGYNKTTGRVEMNSTTFCDQMHIEPNTPETKNCLSLYWNLCNDDAVDYYVNTVLGNMVSKGGRRRNMDGLFIDWAGNFKDGLCPGQNMKVHLKTFQLLQKYQMWPVFSLAGTTAEAALLWDAGVGYTQFSEYWTPNDANIGALYSLTEVMGVPSIVHTPIIHARSPHTAILDAVAGYLIGAGGATHSYLMYGTSWTSDKGWPWSPLFDIEYGQPLGPPMRTASGNNTVWQRKFASGAGRSAAAPASYAERLQWTHWAMAGGILASYGTYWVSKRASPEGKAMLMSWHKQIGLLLLGGIGARVAFRLSSTIPPHLPGPAYQRIAAHGVHGLMYPLMATIPLTGVAMLYYGGSGLDFLGLHIPGSGKADPKDADKAQAKELVGWHKDLSGAMEVLVPLHIGATGLHIARGSDPLSRMAPTSLQGALNAAAHAVRTRPGSVAGGGALAAVGGAWLASVAWEKLNAGDGGAMVSVDPSQQGRVITLEELEAHNKEDDLWIAVDGKVYDMTKYHKGIRDDLLIGTLERNVKSELARVMNLDDMKKRAHEVLTQGAEAYYNAGAEDGTSMQEALDVWDRDWRLRPRNFIDVSNVDVGTTVLGHRLELPVMAAPTALLKMGHEDGEAAVARGCAAAGVGNCLSTTASLSIEDVAAASPDCYRWFQLYVYRDHEKTKNLVLRAAKEGYSAICLTVDLPVLGNRTSLKRIGFTVPKQFKMANVAKEKETAAEKEAAAKDGVNVKDPGDRAKYVAKLYDQSLTLELLTWLGELTDLPIVVKGILRGDSAAAAARHPNVKGIVVSNHGGRQLDNCLAPLTALPEVIRAVDEVNEVRVKEGLDPVEVYVDGGIKRGRDIFKALALGAKAVMLGRPMIYGMAVGGELGVQRSVEILRDELKTCMQLAGCQNVSQIDRSFIVRHGTDTSDPNWDPAALVVKRNKRSGDDDGTDADTDAGAGGTAATGVADSGADSSASTGASTTVDVDITSCDAAAEGAQAQPAGEASTS